MDIASLLSPNSQSLAFPVVESSLDDDQPSSVISFPHIEWTWDAHEPSAYSQMLAVKVEQHLVPTLILHLDLLVLEVATSRHPAMDLVTEGLDVVFHAQGLAELFHRVRIFVAGREHADRYLDAFGVCGIDHGGVDFRNGGEGGAGLGGEGDDLYHDISNPPLNSWDGKQMEEPHLPTPAHPQTSPLLDPRRLLLNLFQ